MISRMSEGNGGSTPFTFRHSQGGGRGSVGSAPMFDRPCPQCNQPLGRFAKRCLFCGWARGSTLPRTPEHSTLSPSPIEGEVAAGTHDVEAVDRIGPFLPDALPDDAPAAALVLVDLSAWHSNSRATATERLHSLVIPKRWEGETLAFLGAYLDQVARIISDVEDLLEPHLDPSDSVSFDCSDLGAAARTALIGALDEARLAYQLTEGELQVDADDRGRVDRILLDLRAGNVAEPVGFEDVTAGDDTFADEGEDHAYEALDALFGTVDAVRRHPDRALAIDELAQACSRCPIGAPFGISPAIWHDLVAEAGQLARQSDDLDIDTLRARATTLHDRLKQFIA